MIRQDLHPRLGGARRLENEPHDNLESPIIVFYHVPTTSILSCSLFVHFLVRKLGVGKK